MSELRLTVQKQDGVIGLVIYQDNIGTLGILSAEDALKLGAALNQVGGDAPDVDDVTLTMLYGDVGEVFNDLNKGKWRFEEDEESK